VEAEVEVVAVDAEVVAVEAQVVVERPTRRRQLPSI